MAEIFVGRQPIYDRDLEVYAYELMSHSGHAERQPSDQADADKATSEVILNAFLEIGIDRLVARHIAFLKLTERFLSTDETLPLPSDRVILRIPSHIQVTDRVISAARTLIEQGYKLALDNYLVHEHLQPLAGMATIIDIDISALSTTEIHSYIRILKKLHPILLADHVRTYDEYEMCRDLDIDYFQGYFLSRPRIISGESLAPKQISVMNLLNTLHNPETDTKTIDAIISRDVALSYKILKLANSAFFARARKIESIHHAIVMLGRKSLCTWASMLALTGMDDKPKEQVRLAMVRAKSCELLAQSAGFKQLNTFFTVGMFSALDLLMNRSLEEVITPLPLADPIVGALLNREGELGEALNCTLAQETADWVNIRFAGLSTNDLTEVNISALNWADEVLKDI